MIFADVRSAWPVPDYTTDVNMAATHFYLSLTQGLSISHITGKLCGSDCHIERNVSTGVPDKIIAMAFIQCGSQYLDIGKFRAFDGIISHIAHTPNNDSFHLLWKTIKAAPV